MKREIDRVVYRTTLRFLDERIEIYTDYLEAADSCKAKDARYQSILESCQDIRKTFLKTYTEKKE